MKSISLWQPWASLIACGAKPFETRHWAPPRELIGQRIAIHAAKKIGPENREFAEDIILGRHGEDDDARHELAAKVTATHRGIPQNLMGLFGRAFMPVGCIVCTATLDAAFLLGEQATGTARPAASVVRRLVSRQMPECFTVRYDDFGDYAAGRWAWLFRDVMVVTPTEATIGRQGFFDVPYPRSSAEGRAGMKDPLVKIGRLAMRQEGPNWNAYYAMPDTMEGAIWLGSIAMRFVADHADRRTAFMNMMREAVADLMEETTGHRPSWPDGPQPAPQHEKAGSA